MPEQVEASIKTAADIAGQLAVKEVQPGSCAGPSRSTTRRFSKRRLKWRSSRAN